ncbi:MAG: hypothetical protein WB502_01965 [Thermoactinomyces sp.]
MAKLSNFFIGFRLAVRRITSGMTLDGLESVVPVHVFITSFQSILLKA